jgi:hypothetical protein
LVVIALMVPALAAAAGPKEKTEVCHIPPGNPGNAHTISVGGNAANAHVGHGDTLGKCPIERPGRVDDDDDSTDDQTSDNRPPVARAVTNSCIAYGDDMVLDGRTSTDPDGDSLSYLWTIRSHPTGSTLANSDFEPSRTDSHPTVTPDRLGTYVIELEVSDPDGASDDDTVGVTTHMDVELTAGPYVVEEGKTAPVTILFTELAPQDVNVQLVLDTDVAVVVPAADDDAADAISSVVIKKGDNRVTVYLYGVADADKSDDSTVLSAVVGSRTCGDTAFANVEVEDDDVQLQLGWDLVRLLFVRPQLDPWLI